MKSSDDHSKKPRATPPSILYKFLAPELVTNVLGQGTAKFTQMAKTNDVFEVRKTFHNIAGPRLDEMFETMKFEKLQEPAIDEAFKRRLVKHFGRDITPSEFEMVKEAIDKDFLYNTVASEFLKLGDHFLEHLNLPQTTEYLLNEFGEQLLCFSMTESFDNSKMWAHYADNHKGFVVGFDTDHSWFKNKNDPANSRLHKVVYFDGVLGEAFENLEAAFGSKTSNWSFEREWRMYCGMPDIEKTIELPTDSIHLIRFPPELVQSVIVGAKASHETIDAIKGVVRDRYTHAKLFTAKPNNRTTSFDLEPLAY